MMNSSAGQKGAQQPVLNAEGNASVISPPLHSQSTIPTSQQRWLLVHT